MNRIPKIVLTVLFTFFYSLGFTQITQPLPVDENGRITFSEVKEVPGSSKSLLLINALDYAQSLKESARAGSDLDINADSSELRLPIQFNVYREFPVRSPHGLIKYQLTVSLKEGRYRYVATNFVFHYLKRNRYGRFVEVKGKSKPMETPVFKGQQDLWDGYKQQLHAKIESQAQVLSAFMNMPQSAPEKEVVKIQSDW